MFFLHWQHMAYLLSSKRWCMKQDWNGADQSLYSFANNEGATGNAFSVGSITESLWVMAALASLNSLVLLLWCLLFPLSLFLFFSQEVATQRWEPLSWRPTASRRGRSRRPHDTMRTWYHFPGMAEMFSCAAEMNPWEENRSMEIILTSVGRTSVRSLAASRSFHYFDTFSEFFLGSRFIHL